MIYGWWYYGKVWTLENVKSGEHNWRSKYSEPKRKAGKGVDYAKCEIERNKLALPVGEAIRNRDIAKWMFKTNQLFINEQVIVYWY